MEARGIDVCYVPSGDFHGSEYVNDFFKAREFVSGLTGEAGELVVTENVAYLWTDARYFLQAERQLAGSGIELMRMAEPGVPTLEDFLAELAQKRGGYVLGFDGRVLPAKDGVSFKEKLAPLGVTLKWDVDLVGEIWTSRPPLKPSRIFELPMSSTGVSASEKVAAVRSAMAEKGADCLLISDLMETAWLLNLRGRDIAYTPVFFSYILLNRDSLRLFVMDGALPNGNLPSGFDFVKVERYDTINSALAGLPSGSVLWLDPASANYALRLGVADGIKIIEEQTPIAVMKAIKNETEIRSTINAHVKDAVAVIKFIKWIKDAAKTGTETELSAAEKLRAYRFEQEGCFDLSFETIVGYGPNGAIIHYAPTPETDAVIKPEGLLLVDSGGQYTDGTTDITRTIAVGPITQDMKDKYTYVLKAHIAMATARLAPGENGIELNSIARAPLKAVGLDFKHGLSHGVGHVLSVHEGPNVLRRTPTPIEIKPGMIMSNEPGVYIDGEYGIRIENEVLFKADDSGMIINEPITFVPYERVAINTALLTKEEIAWLNGYNELIRRTIVPLLNDELAAFVMAETEPFFSEFSTQN